MYSGIEQIDKKEQDLQPKGGEEPVQPVPETIKQIVRNLPRGTLVAAPFANAHLEAGASAKINGDVIVTELYVKCQYPEIQKQIAAMLPKLPQWLRDYYQSQDAFIPRVLPTLPKLPIEKCFVNLSIIEKRTQSEQEKNEFKGKKLENRTRIYSSYEAIFSDHAKTPVKPEELFSRTDKRRLIVFGQAGIGKSTLVQYLSYHWATGDLWKDKFEYVFKIKLRHLTKQNYSNIEPFLPNIIAKECFPNHRVSSDNMKFIANAVSQLLSAQAQTILIILDGLDEFDEDISPCSKAIVDLLNGSQTNPQVHLLVTSRPFAKAAHQYLSNEQVEQLECKGFLTEDIPKYIRLEEVKLNQEEQADIITFLENNPNIHTLAHVPILLDMLCAIWDKDLPKEKSLMTMTEFYEKLMGKLWEQYNIRQKELYPELRPEERTERKNKAKQFLEVLAFKAMEEGQVMISGELVCSAIKEVYQCENEDIVNYIEEVLAPGLLYSPNFTSDNYAHCDYYFPHLTFAEYLVAQKIARSYPAEEKEGWEKSGAYQETQRLLERYQYHPRYALIWPWVAGSLKAKPNSLKRYFQDLLVNEELSGLEELIQQIRCFDESACLESLGKETSQLYSDRLWLVTEVWLKYYMEQLRRAMTETVRSDAKRLCEELIRSRQWIAKLRARDNAFLPKNVWSFKDFLISTKTNLLFPYVVSLISSKELLEFSHQLMQMEPSYSWYRFSYILPHLNKEDRAQCINWMQGILETLFAKKSLDRENIKFVSDLLKNILLQVDDDQVINYLRIVRLYFFHENLWLRRCAIETLNLLSTHLKSAQVEECFETIKSAYFYEDGNINASVFDILEQILPKLSNSQIAEFLPLIKKINLSLSNKDVRGGAFRCVTYIIKLQHLKDRKDQLPELSEFSEFIFQIINVWLIDPDFSDMTESAYKLLFSIINETQLNQLLISIQTNLFNTAYNGYSFGLNIFKNLFLRFDKVQLEEFLAWIRESILNESLQASPYALNVFLKLLPYFDDEQKNEYLDLIQDQFVQRRWLDPILPALSTIFLPRLTTDQRRIYSTTLQKNLIFDRDVQDRYHDSNEFLDELQNIVLYLDEKQLMDWWSWVETDLQPWIEKNSSESMFYFLRICAILSDGFKDDRWSRCLVFAQKIASQEMNKVHKAEEEEEEEEEEERPLLMDSIIAIEILIYLKNSCQMERQSGIFSKALRVNYSNFDLTDVSIGFSIITHGYPFLNQNDRQQVRKLINDNRDFNSEIIRTCDIPLSLYDQFESHPDLNVKHSQFLKFLISSRDFLFSYRAGRLTLISFGITQAIDINLYHQLLNMKDQTLHHRTCWNHLIAVFTRDEKTTTVGIDFIPTSPQTLPLVQPQPVKSQPAPAASAQVLSQQGTFSGSWQDSVKLITEISKLLKDIYENREIYYENFTIEQYCLRLEELINLNDRKKQKQPFSQEEKKEIDEMLAEVRKEKAEIDNAHKPAPQ